MAIKLTKDALIKAHDEIDKEVGIEPPIDSELPSVKYEKELFKTIGQLDLEPSEIAALSKDTQQIIKALNEKYGDDEEEEEEMPEEEEEKVKKPAKKAAPAPAPKKKPTPAPEPEDEDEEEADEEEEEEPVKPAAKKSAKKPEPEKPAKKPAKKPEPEPEEDEDEDEEEADEEEAETSLYDQVKATKKFDELKEIVAENAEFKKIKKNLADYKNPILLKKAMMDVLVAADPSLQKAKEEKKPAKEKVKRTGPSLTEQRINFYKPLIEKAKFTKTQLLEKGLAEFEGVQKSALQTFLIDSKNPKYNKFDKLVVEDPETHIMSFKEAKAKK